MAFFSLSNFSAPFRNKVHIVTIVLVAIVFTVFRSSGGSIKPTNEAINDNVKIDNLDVNLLNKQKEVNNTKKTSNSVEDSYFFRNSRNKNFDLESDSKPKVPPKNRNSKSGSSNLEDIYNQLNF